MDRIVIRGAKSLNGTIYIGGAKNAALPLLASCLLSEQTLTLSNLPHLVDVSSMAHLLAELGVSISMNGNAGGGGNMGRVFELTACGKIQTLGPALCHVRGDPGLDYRRRSSPNICHRPNGDLHHTCD